MFDDIFKKLEEAANQPTETRYYFDGKEVLSDKFYINADYFTDWDDPEFTAYQLFASKKECLDYHYAEAIAQAKHIRSLMDE